MTFDFRTVVVWSRILEVYSPLECPDLQILGKAAVFNCSIRPGAGLLHNDLAEQCGLEACEEGRRQREILCY